MEIVLGLFDQVETNRLALLKEEDIAEKELQESSKIPKDEDESDDNKQHNLII